MSERVNECSPSRRCYVPGPWRVEDRVTNKTRDDFNILVGTPTTDVCEVYNSDAEAEATARLIAQSPVMFELLKRARAVLWESGRHGLDSQIGRVIESVEGT